MKPLAPFTINAPGFYGLNTQDSPVDMNPGFALEAKNCVIDKSGRVASRKGWTTTHTTNSDLGSANIECIGELISNDGSSTILAAGNGFLFTLAGGTLTTLTYGGGGVAPTISANNWKFCQLNGVAMFWQRGHDPLIFEPAVSTSAFRRLSERSGSVGTVYQCNEAISAFGRVWAADTATDAQTVVFSDIISPHVWTGGTSGSLDLTKIWPRGGDKIVGLASHNNFLVIFGHNQILIYSGANDPASMVLADSIIGTGCIARDSIQNTGDDIIFLSDAGVLSLRRTIQEKSAPIRGLSKNVMDEIQTHASVEDVSKIKSVYSALNNFYVLTMPSFYESYVFDTKAALEDGSFRVTTWTGIDPKAFCETKDRNLYIGQAGYVGLYGGYLDNAAEYRISYYTTWIDFGDPIMTSILKKIILTLIGGTNQTIVFKWGYNYNTGQFSQATAITGQIDQAEYGTAEYGLAEYSGNLSVNTLSVNGTSAGKLLQFGFEAQVAGRQISVQRIDLYTKNGRLE